MSESRRGVWYGVAAYGLWGLLPLYWALLEPSGALEILDHRILWSLAFTLLLVGVRRQWPALRAAVRSRRTLVILTAAAVLIAGNWGTYIYGVNSGQVVETSLGYFINPLVSVALGVLIFRERLRHPQWIAVGIGAVAVLVLAVDYGRPPYIALILAFTFGFYGLLKKIVAVPPVQGLAVESAVLAIPALISLGVLAARGQATFGTVSGPHTALIMLTGVMTAIPLLFFAAGAPRVPLSTMGLLQYLAPAMQFALGLTVFGEPMPPGRLIGFVLVWVALSVFTVDLLRHRRRPFVEEPSETVPAG
ncbi:MAG: EamA family transporter RarD [Geodermatophilaceae bacterium]|nr:EamA family transporter RarD [Geodermatophilaceae bacterium]MDQ3456425.1 EamA family transporter RarD [Actinomycetota bacterium]